MDAFRRAVGSFAEANQIPVVRLKAADRNAEGLCGLTWIRPRRRAGRRWR
jgi:hypothetical protein